MNDDLDEEIIGSDEGFDEFQQKSSLGDLIRRSAAAKVVIVLLIVCAVVATLYTFGGEKEQEVKSSVPAASDVTSAPGDEGEVTPSYVDAVEQQNQADLERAIREGDSSIPVPIETPGTRLEVPEVEEVADDPLHRWRVLQDERISREMKARELEEEPVTVLDAEQQSEAINKLSDVMSTQMDSILSKTTEETTFTTKTLITYEDIGNGSGPGGQAAGGPASSQFTEEAEETVIIPAGKVYYAQLLLEANSDVPETVLAELVSGPLKGWKLLGSFEVLDDIQMLAITFDVAVNEDGKQHQIEAVMLNPDTTLAAMRTDINHHYIKRIVLPAASAFIEGYAEALAETGRTDITVSGGSNIVSETEEADSDEQVASGVVEAAGEVSEILDEMADIPVRIIIESGAAMGVFFTANVVETEADI